MRDHGVDLPPDKEALRQLLDLEIGRRRRDLDLLQAQAKLRNYFLENAYYDARVDIDTEEDAADHSSRIRFEVREGKPVRVRRVDISGNTATREDVIRFVNEQRCSFPDLRDTIHEILAQGDLVAVRFTRTATFDAKWRDLEPTRRTDSVSMFQLVRIAGDQIAESWLVWDSARLEKLLGIYGREFCKEVYP